MAQPAAGRPAMYAEAGDVLMVTRVRAGGPPRECEVLAVRRADGGPPYLVRWSDTGYQALVTPGLNARVEHVRRHRAW